MTPRHPTARERRTIVIASAVALAVVAPAKLLPRWREYRAEQHAAAVELLTELARAEASVAALPWLRDSLVARRERYIALAPRLLAGDSPATASAALAGLISGAAQGANLRMGSVQMRSDTVARGGFVRVRVQTDLTGDIHGVTALLLALERGPQLVRVRRLSVTQAEPAAPPDRVETLRVDLVVEGISLAERKERAK